jgi:preprotein translocase SecF subunit
VFDIIGKRNWLFALSLAVTVPGLIFILLGPITGGKVGLQFAIDFTGGTEWSIRFQDENVTPDQVKSVFTSLGFDASVTKTGDKFMEIRTKEATLAAVAPVPSAVTGASPSASVAAPSASAGASPSAAAGASAAASTAPSASVTPSASASTSPAPSGSAAPSSSPAAGASPSASPAPGSNQNLPTTGQLGEVRKALEAAYGPIAEQRSLSSVGAIVSSDLIQQALMLILVGSIGILLWITYRFRDFKMGVTALVALLHDVIVVVGMFAILGTFLGLQIDSLFVTAMLTVIGFSVHDTIVVFDRIRENRSRHAGEPFDRIVNHSVLQTFGRSITTSLTVVITLLTLLLFAGAAIGTFTLALLLGIISGTYSSIFNASPLLVVWHQYEDRKRLRENAARPSRRAAT